MLPPMEAVQAAKLQSLAASEELDRGLRRAFWGESRCISLRHVILEVATECEAVDVEALGEALDDGRARRALFDDWTIARGDEVRGSAHLFAPDGTNAQNPGIDDRLARGRRTAAERRFSSPTIQVRSRTSFEQPWAMTEAPRAIMLSDLSAAEARAIFERLRFRPGGTPRNVHG